MPTSEEITEEGFGYFRSTWFIGRVPVREAEQTVHVEGKIIEWLDRCAFSAETFELLARAIEGGYVDDLPEPVRRAALAEGIEAHVGQEGGVPARWS